MHTCNYTNDFSNSILNLIPYQFLSFHIRCVFTHTKITSSIHYEEIRMGGEWHDTKIFIGLRNLLLLPLVIIVNIEFLVLF